VKLNGWDGASDALLAFFVLVVEVRDGRGDDAADREEVGPLPMPVPALPELPFRTAGVLEEPSLPPGAVRFLK
jgi:hypothetical protein